MKTIKKRLTIEVVDGKLVLGNVFTFDPNQEIQDQKEEDEDNETASITKSIKDERSKL